MGEFIEGLSELGVLENTAIFVMGDHGQADTGWHPLEIIDSSITTLVMWGAGIKSGARIPYAEIIDIVPTICRLMETKPPETSQGLALFEALSGIQENAPSRKMLIKNMLEEFVEFRKKTAEASYRLEQMPEARSGLLFSQFGRICQKYYDIHRFVEWPRFATIEELLEHNSGVMTELDKFMEEVRK